MKKKISTIILFISALSHNLYAHDGHLHTGTYWENITHFMITNGYIVVPVIVAGYFLINQLRSAKRVKNK